MANFTITPNMSLILPIPGVDPGPDYATNQYNSGFIIDGHNHSPGSGVPIGTNGIDINSDLPINNNNLTLVKTVNFGALVAPLPGTAPNLGAVYVAGNELYYNDEVGNVVQITNSGSVNAGAGSITGLPSGTASASYSSGSQTFIWQSATNTAANMDMGSVIIREVAASANGITIKSPGSLAAPYSLTLLTALPGVTSFLAVDSSGNLSTTIPTTGGISGSQIANQTITEDKLALRPFGSTVGIGGYATSASTGNPGFSLNGSSGIVDVTGLTVTITTTGRPVVLALAQDTSGLDCAIDVSTGTPPLGYNLIFFVRGSTTVASLVLGGQEPVDRGLAVPPSSFMFIDTPAAGTYTYKVQAECGPTTTTMIILRTILTAYEL